MKKFLLPLILLISYSLSSTLLYAADKWANDDFDHFPIQPVLIYDDTKRFINPFEMASFGIGAGPTWIWNPQADIPNYFLMGTIKWEMPFHERTRSIGLDISPFIALAGNIEDEAAVIDITCDILGTYKFKKPFHTPLGYIAGTMTAKGGPTIKLNPDADAFENIGGVLGGSVGVDYYPSQWVGVFFEYTLKYNYIFISPQQQPRYGYFNSALTIGFKTTF